MFRKRMSPDERKSAMLTQPLPKIIISMAIPTIISFLINTVYQLADTFFVSSLGTNATAAVSVNTSLDNIIMMAGSMVGIGAGSYISRLLGAKRDDEAHHVLSTAFFLAAAFGVCVLAVGLSFMHPMVRLLGATDTCEQYAVEYATYILVVAPFMATNFVMNQCLRSEGSAVRSMIGMGFGGILNIFLDPIFIFKFGLGVAGASMATALSKLVSFGILLYPYIRRRSILRLSIKLFGPTKIMMKEIVSVGSSSLLRNACAVLSGIVLNNIAGNISDSVLAGVGVSFRVMMIPFGIILGFSMGFQPVAGFNWGARNYDRVRGSFRFSSVTSLIGGAVMAGICALFAPQIIDLFSKSDPEMRAFGALCIRLQCIALPIHGWVAVVNGLCAGLGFGKASILLATSRQGSCFFPIVYPLSYFFGTLGVASVQASADILSLVLAIPILKWVHRKIDDAEKGLLDKL